MNFYKVVGQFTAYISQYLSEKIGFAQIAGVVNKKNNFYFLTKGGILWKIDVQNTNQYIVPGTRVIIKGEFKTIEKVYTKENLLILKDTDGKNNSLFGLESIILENGKRFTL